MNKQLELEAADARLKAADARLKELEAELTTLRAARGAPTVALASTKAWITPTEADPELEELLSQIQSYGLEGPNLCIAIRALFLRQEAVTRHMEAARAVLGVPDDETLVVRCQELLAELAAHTAALKGAMTK